MCSLRCKKKRYILFYNKLEDFILNFFKDFCFMKISNSLNGKFTVDVCDMCVSVKILFLLYLYIRYKKNMECYTIFF